MAVFYIVAKDGGAWRLYVKDTGTGHTRWTPGSKQQAIKDGRQGAKNSVESSMGPNSSLLIVLNTDREVNDVVLYGEDAPISASVRKDEMVAGPFGVPVDVTFVHGPGNSGSTIRLASYMTKGQASANARKVQKVGE